MATNVSLQCTCGSVRGRATNTSAKTGARLVCMCDDCQCYAHHLERADVILDANGGTEVFQLSPAQVEITGGHEHVRCLRLSPKGLMRWYAGCCNTPIANTLRSPKIPFAGLHCTFIRPDLDGQSLDDALGPLRGRTQARFGHGPLPPDAHPRASLGIIVHALSVLGRAWLRGGHRPSPFFDAHTGAAVVEPTVISLETRQALRDRVAANTR